MTRKTRRSIAAIAAAIGLPFSMASGPSLAAQAARPDVPATLEPPAGFVLFFAAHAVGTQNYVCLPSGTAYAWRFIAPQATLSAVVKGAGPQQVMTHFLSPNPDEAGTARPTWQHSVDTSRVWGRAIASSIDPAYVEPGAIPWLLLEQIGVERGPAGGAFLTQTAYIQRINTSGGVAPSTGCAQPTDVGALALVPYETDYAFYRAPKRGQSPKR
jgi:hypothetical protein